MPLKNADPLTCLKLPSFSHAVFVSLFCASLLCGCKNPVRPENTVDAKQQSIQSALTEGLNFTNFKKFAQEINSLVTKNKEFGEEVAAGLTDFQLARQMKNVSVEVDHSGEMAASDFEVFLSSNILKS